MSKYKITEHHITQPGGVEKMKRDGYTRSEIMQSMYKITSGASKDERSKLVSDLFRKD